MEWHAETGNMMSRHRGTMRYNENDSEGKRLCRYVRNGEMCPYGESCHFSHEPSREEAERGKRMLLAGFKRLREEKQEHEENKKQKELDDAGPSELMELLMSSLR